MVIEEIRSNSPSNFVPDLVDVDGDSLKWSVLFPLNESQHPSLVPSGTRQNSPHLDPLEGLNLLTHRLNSASPAVQIRTIVDQGKDTPLIEILEMSSVKKHRSEAPGSRKRMD
jgi:hypothetical protein